MSKLPDPPGDLSLENACDTDEVHALASKLAAWALRSGMAEGDVVDWVLDQPRAASLPRGSSGRDNPTQHHVHTGAQYAVDTYIPGLRPKFDPDPLHEFAARIEGSGVTHERYLLGVISLCFKYETLTPVVTGPLLAQVVGVAESVAGKVLRKWSTTLAYGFFTGVAYDGERGHGRVWTVDPGWVPVSKPKHGPGCNRSRGRCACFSGLSQNGLSILAADNDRSPKVRQEFETWVMTKPVGGTSGSGITTTDVCKALGVTRHVALKLLREAQGSLLDEFTFQGGRTRKRTVGADGKVSFAWVRCGETWFRSKGTANGP